MQKEYLTSFQLSCIIMMVIMAATLVFGVGYAIEQDAWISLIFALILLIPVILMYGRIMYLLPEKNIFEMLEELFGKIFGKILITIFNMACLLSRCGCFTDIFRLYTNGGNA